MPVVVLPGHFASLPYISRMVPRVLSLPAALPALVFAQCSNLAAGGAENGALRGTGLRMATDRRTPHDTPAYTGATQMYVRAEVS